MWRSYHVDPGPHAPPPPSQKKRPKKSSAQWDRKRFKRAQVAKKIGGVRIDNLNAFPAVWKTSIFYFFSRGARPRTPQNPSRVSNRPEFDENISILPENPNRDSISVGTQEQVSQANN